MADDLFSGIGSALGGLLGGASSFALGQQGVDAINNLTSAGIDATLPYNANGQQFAPAADSVLTGDSTGSNNIGMGRIDASANPVDFQDFAKNYNTSEGAQYLMKTATAAQDSTAAARGGLLSGANLRADTGIAEGIANQDLMSQYQATLQGQQQDFSQREQSYSNIYGQEALGENAGVAEGQVAGSGANAIGRAYGAMASNAQSAANSFGSGLGSIFGTLFKAFA